MKMLDQFDGTVHEIRKIEAAYKSFQSHDALSAGLKSWQIEVVHNTAMAMNHLGISLRKPTRRRESSWFRLLLARCLCMRITRFGHEADYSGD
jgi:hypothetical protein